MTEGYASIEEIKSANEKLGLTWFSAQTVKYHGSKPETDVISGFWFVESSFKDVGEPESGRAYRAVAASQDGTVSYLAGGQVFDSIDAARTCIDKAAGNL